MKLELDTKRLMNDIIKELNKEMDEVAKVLVEFMIGELSMYSGRDKEFDEWKLDVIDEIKFRSKASSMAIVKEIGILNQNDFDLMYKAMILNFGRGKLMDTTGNPWLAEYLSSEYYHGDERQGGEIRARAGMDVYDINTGGWKKSKATNTDVLPFFDEKGSHFWTNIFGNSAIMAQTYFDKGIDNAISRIDFSNYLIVK